MNFRNAEDIDLYAVSCLTHYHPTNPHLTWILFMQVPIIGIVSIGWPKGALFSPLENIFVGSPGQQMAAV